MNDEPASAQQPSDDQPMNHLTAEVLVVGAGPTGLMLANWLACLGVGVIVIDGKAGPTTESRALVVQARSMEIYDQLGIAEEVLAQTVPVRSIAPGFGTRVFGRIPIGEIGAGTTPYSSLFVLEQSRNEQILYDNLRRLGGEVLWGHELDTIELERLERLERREPDTVETDSAADGDPLWGVTASIRGSRGAVTVRARYCVGADGTNSAVRQLTGIQFEGATNEHLFYVCDAVGVTGLVSGAVNIRPAPHDVLLSFPMGQGEHHRVIGILRTPDDAVVEEAVRARLGLVYGVDWIGTRWFSTYRVHHRVAAEFRRGPIFLAGDAAHVHSPVGAQGMNTGLQDAHNLALALGDVFAGRAPDASLDRYEAERRPVARRLVSTTDRVFAAVTSERLIASAVRRGVIPLVGPIAVRLLPKITGAPRLFEYVSQVRIHYWMSEQDRARGRRGATVGRRLPWSGDNFAVLRSATWQVHAYGSVNPSAVDRLGAQLGVPVHTFPAPSTQRLRAGMFYLVRPDGFVAAQATASRAAEVFRASLPEQYLSAAGG